MTRSRSSGSGEYSPARPTRRVLDEHRRRRRLDPRGPSGPLAARPARGLRSRGPQARQGLRDRGGFVDGFRPDFEGLDLDPRAGGSARPDVPPGPPRGRAGLEVGADRGDRSRARRRDLRQYRPAHGDGPRRTRARSLAGSIEEAGCPAVGKETDRAAQCLPRRAARRARGAGTRARGTGVHARRGLRLVALRAQAGRGRAPLGPGRRDDHRRASRAPIRSIRRWGSPSSGPLGSRQARPFDEHGDGLIVGEGAGLFVLKRLDDAIRHGDTIHGVIRGIGLSNDVHGDLLAPSSEGQLRAMRRPTSRRAGRRATSI